jgi:hypothetical protein
LDENCDVRVGTTAWEVFSAIWDFFFTNWSFSLGLENHGELPSTWPAPGSSSYMQIAT